MHDVVFATFKKNQKWCSNFRAAVVSDIPFQTLTVTTPMRTTDTRLQVVSDNGYQATSGK